MNATIIQSHDVVTNWPNATGWEDLFNHAAYCSLLYRVANFIDDAAARRFKRQHPAWQVFVAMTGLAEVGGDGELTAVTDAEFTRRLGGGRW